MRAFTVIAITIADVYLPAIAAAAEATADFLTQDEKIKLTKELRKLNEDIVISTKNLKLAKTMLKLVKENMEAVEKPTENEAKKAKILAGNVFFLTTQLHGLELQVLRAAKALDDFSKGKVPQVPEGGKPPGPKPGAGDPGPKPGAGDPERLRAQEDFNKAFAQLTLSRFDFEREQLDAQTAAFIEAGVSETDAAAFQAEARKQIAQREMQDKIDFARQATAAIGLILNNQLQTDIQRIKDRLAADITAVNKAHDVEIESIRTSQLSAEEKEVAIALARENRESKINSFRDSAVEEEKKAAKKIKKIRLAMVAIETALYIVEAFPSPIKMAAAAALGGLQGAAINAQTFAKGGAIKGGVQAFASGGVVNRPTLFPMRPGAGLMGEAGPEAILPLDRTSSGDLVVQTTCAGGDFIVQFLAPVTDEDFVRESIVPIIEDSARSLQNSIALR